MVFDADARRSRAVNRLARWADRESRWSARSVWDVPGFTNPRVRWARVCREAAERAVERAAARDVVAGRAGPHSNYLASVVPARRTEQHPAAYVAALAHYRYAAHQLGGLVAAAGWRTPPEGMSEKHRSGVLRRYDDQP